MKLKLLLALTLGTLILPAAVIYQQNFEATPLGAPPSEFSGSGISSGPILAVESTGGLSAFGFGARHLRNNAGGAPEIGLVLVNLAPHTSLTISFDLIVWDSMDAGKLFGVRFDSFNLLSPVDTSNYSAGPGGFTGPGTLLSAPVIDGVNPDYGRNSANRDQGRRIAGITFAHVNTSVGFIFSYSGASVTGGLDESFGIDNIVISDNNVTTSGVPEPSTMALAGLALAFLAGQKYRYSRNS